jgi:hypothetical protein
VRCGRCKQTTEREVHGSQCCGLSCWGCMCIAFTVSRVHRIHCFPCASHSLYPVSRIHALTHAFTLETRQGRTRRDKNYSFRSSLALCNVGGVGIQCNLDAKMIDVSAHGMAAATALRCAALHCTACMLLVGYSTRTAPQKDPFRVKSTPATSSCSMFWAAQRARGPSGACGHVLSGVSAARWIQARREGSSMPARRWPDTEPCRTRACDSDAAQRGLRRRRRRRRTTALRAFLPEHMLRR